MSYLMYSFPVRYQGCGTEVRVPASRFDNDMSLTPQLPATLFDAPILRWRSDPGEMFTMAFVDPGFSYLHQLVINIEGDDLMTGDVSFICDIYYSSLFY